MAQNKTASTTRHRTGQDRPGHLPKNCVLHAYLSLSSCPPADGANIFFFSSLPLDNACRLNEIYCQSVYKLQQDLTCMIVSCPTSDEITALFYLDRFVRARSNETFSHLIYVGNSS